MGDVEVVGSEFFGTGLAFPSLESLSFQDMWGWKVWSTNSGSGVADSVFPCLKELHIEGCPNLVEVSLKAPLLSLRDLTINKCGGGLLRNLVHVAPSVTKLAIRNISGLTDEVWSDVVLDLKVVEELTVVNCDEIRYLWESKEGEASSKVLVNLRKLEVWNCNNMASLGEKDVEEEYNYGSNVLISLSSLWVYECENFKHLSCPNNIESLSILGCNLMACVSFSKGGGQKLKSVEIFRCKKVLLKEELELGEGGEKNVLLINNKTMPMLQSVDISFHQNLASIIEFGGNFIHLTKLTIWNCKSTAQSLFADIQLQSLTSLTDLNISNCKSMDVPTAGLLWPPNLRVLSIGYLKKPISEWAPQEFPSKLVDLTLHGHGEREAATNWSELSHLHLPSSLTRLLILDFEKLESLSEGLRHLTSLQHLGIWWCPKMKDLPETLLPSLLSLDIHECQELKERCSKRGGSYWPLIFHIPEIIIFSYP